MCHPKEVIMRISKSAPQCSANRRFLCLNRPDESYERTKDSPITISDPFCVTTSLMLFRILVISNYLLLFSNYLYIRNTHIDILA